MAIMEKTLFGVDAVHYDALVGRDINEKDILCLLDSYEQRKIIVTPIGGNGFIFGRGSKPLTPTVIRRVGRENVILVATRHKLRERECVRVDTGGLELDETLAGFMKITVGYREWMMVEARY